MYRPDVKPVYDRIEACKTELKQLQRQECVDPYRILALTNSLAYNRELARQHETGRG